jgi:hypothetical protein
MNTTEYKPNSHKFKKEQEHEAKEEKRVEKVIKGTAKVKKNEMRKIADVFISEDVKNVKSYVLMDVLVPTIKKAIVDIVTDGINMIFFGGTASRKSSITRADKVSYRSFYGSDNARMNDRTQRTTSKRSYDDIVYETRAEAKEVLERLEELISKYGFATVADLYDLSGLTCDYTDNKYGWIDLRSADVLRIPDGYVIKLPRAAALDI